MKLSKTFSTTTKECLKWKILKVSLECSTMKNNINLINGCHSNRLITATLLFMESHKKSLVKIFVSSLLSQFHENDEKCVFFFIKMNMNEGEKERRGGIW